MDTGSIILTSFLSTIPVYLFFATGFYLRHKQVIQADHDAPIMRIAMDVAYPCLVFHSIMKYMVLSGNETLSSVSFSLQAIGAGALELLLGIASAWLVAKMLSMRIGTGLRTFTLTAGVQNYAFFVIPIIQMLFTASNDPTLGVLFVHNVGCELVVWSIGVIIIAGGPGNLNMGVFFRGPLLAVIVGSVVFYRPFCKWLCPLGAFYALLNKVSLFQMRVDTHKCVSCGACAKACKMDVDITKTPNHAECIRCGMCMKACPTDAIQYKFGLGDQSNTETTKE